MGPVNRYRHSLIGKLLLSIGVTLLLSLSVWWYFHLGFVKKTVEIDGYQQILTLLAGALFIGTTAMLIFIIVHFITRPVDLLIRGAHRIEQGDYTTPVQIDQKGELHELAVAINKVGYAIGEKTAALNRQRDEYQNLFETVPCIITVQDRDYRLIGFNREFATKFAPLVGDYCYRVYKGRDNKCPDCPVEKTFQDGKSHFSEETGIDKDGTVKHWFVRTSPIRDEDGNIVAAMEMNLDITERKHLEKRLAQSEKKYHAIFHTIPNPVLVLDPNTLEILDHNKSVMAVYGYDGKELVGTSFLNLFWDPNPDLAEYIKSTTIIERAKHRHKEGRRCYVTIRISPSAYGGQQVLLVTLSDITKRLETEQQLIQASKMATLGEMATGVAHELNQPLSVIKTASNFFIRKIRRQEPIEESTLLTLAEEIDSHVQRAAKIIGHMRQFGRKSDELALQPLQLNDVVQRAFELFSQQLRVRGIEVHWEMAADLPNIAADAGRLEQVLINLLINARDAIEERRAADPNPQSTVKLISLRSFRRDQHVVLEICDSGVGIPEAYMDKIFEPFFTTKKVGQGTGLGLSISYGIIQECHGSIYARPRPAGGTCFVLEFPIPEEA
jgi:histidine kinase